MDDGCRLSFVGKFSINRQLICNEPDVVHMLLSQGIVIAADADFYSDSINYLMFSPTLFREINEGEIPPEYVFTLAVDPNGQTHIADIEEIK